MHDIESCRTILDAVDRESRERNGKRVVRIKLSVGALSGTNPKHLRETLLLCSRSTIAEGAELELVKKLARIRCRDCNYEFETDGPGLPGCKKCGSLKTWTIDGDGVTLESLEIETD